MSLHCLGRGLYFEPVNDQNIIFAGSIKRVCELKKPYVLQTLFSNLCNRHLLVRNHSRIQGATGGGTAMKFARSYRWQSVKPGNCYFNFFGLSMKSLSSKKCKNMSKILFSVQVRS